MRILAHRGAWGALKEKKRTEKSLVQKNQIEKNSTEAIVLALQRGWGIETDVRDDRGRLVISHDIADETAPALEEIFRCYQKLGADSFLALNIKADGIQQLLLEQVTRYGIRNFAVFDMSVPEEVVYESMKIPFLTRQSEIEPEPVLYDRAAGVWMDQWREEWITGQRILEHVRNGKIVGIISPEIHGMEHQRLWDMIKSVDSDQILLCTDRPEEAEEYFYG